ncbi:MAG: hypothetical protein ACPGJV_08770 [Bacteriovoracaceae bacterium]
MSALKKYFENSELLAILLIFFVLAIMLVMLRMKSIDLGFELSTQNKEYEKVLAVNKDLRAKRASLLSANNLKKLAKKHKLKEPKAKQLIIIE